MPTNATTLAAGEGIAERACGSVMPARVYLGVLSRVELSGRCPPMSGRFDIIGPAARPRLSFGAVRVVAVVPTFNEADNIEMLFGALRDRRALDRDRGGR